jgi:alpha-galactosidase
MASPEEIQQMLDWASVAFTGRKPAGRESAVRVELRRQDHSALRFGQSCLDTPLRIGAREFAHGLGTHANSEIVLHLPAGAKRFLAQAGIDNNFDTEGKRGSAQFSLELAGKEIWRSGTLKGGEPPKPVAVDLPPGARALVLKVDTTPDGPGHDQADWADPQVELEDGRVVWADEDRQPFLSGTPPFSFVYGAARSSELLPAWERTAEFQEAPNAFKHTVCWTQPGGGLQVVARVTAFKRYPAVDWVLEFANQGAQDSPLLEDIQALNVQLRTGFYRRPVVLHHLRGDLCNEQSFLPLETVVEPGKDVALAPSGGRSSNGAFPFFNAQYGEEGLIAAVGWSGQWLASLRRSPAGPTALQAGLEKTHLRLHPGERIRSPRILVLPWKGDRHTAHVRFRRLLLFEYAPKLNGRPVRLPVAAQCFDRYNWTRPDWGTEAGQLRAVRATQQLGCDMHWLDAAWFEGGFPNGVGNWFPKPDGFPRGLAPLSEACHQAGLQFMVWFEPERVAPGSRIAREHPEFVFGAAQGGLFKLGEPAARRWLTDLLSARIGEFGLDVYRNDFNIDPLDFWRRNDAPDRQGLAEIRYVEGHYAMWDELLARHPRLRIDNCASGGRRIDLETCRRAVPLWRSDTSCSPGHADWNQTQTYGLSLYVPLFSACAWTPEAYDLRSAATAGVICQFAFLDDDFPFESARAAVAEAKENLPYWYGDFYPLTRCTTAPDAWMAWQFHRADLNAGIVLAFRRSECPYPVFQTGLRALRPESRYSVQFSDEARHQTQSEMTGSELMRDLELRLPKRGASLLVRYSGRRGGS